MLSIKKKIAMALTTTALGAMLVGAGTFALFTANATNTGNTFTAGTLGISLDKPEGTKYFDVSNIAPGDSGTANVVVKNDGSLRLRYDVKALLQGDLANGANPLQVHYFIDGVEFTPATTNNFELDPNETDTITINWNLPSAAGNEYMGDSAKLDLAVIAEQTRNN